MVRYKFIVEYYTSKLNTVKVYVVGKDIKVPPPRALAPEFVAEYISRIAKSEIPEKKIILMNQHVKKSGGAQIHFINDLWLVVPLEPEKALRKFPNRKLFSY